MRFHVPARFLLAAILMVGLTLTRTLAQIPRTLSYQAVLTDNSGTPKPDGPYTVTFRLYAAANGGISLWTEIQVVQVKNGLFGAVLGSVTPFGDGLAFTQPYWLGLEVAPDPELPSRLPLTASGYSLGPWTTTTPPNNGPAKSGSEGNIYYNSGNVGIGTVAPDDKLDVVGTLRASSPSSNQITVQTTGPTNSWAQFRMSTINQTWLMGTSQGFLGDQFYLSDLTSNLSRMTIQPNGGEISFPSPSSNHIVVRTSGGTNSWAQLRMSTTNRTWAIGTSQEFNGDQFYLSDLTSNQTRIMIQPNAGAITFPLGNVGIGTTTPTQKLDIAGSVHVAGNLGTDGSANIGGNVGIGTTAPTQKLDVAGNVHVGGNVGVDGGAYISGSTVQNRDQGGFVKAMVYVHTLGAINRNYNPYGNTTVQRISTGSYVVDFGFQVDDRFYSITTHARQPKVVGGFRFASANTAVIVELEDIIAEEPIDWPFMIIVY